MYQNVKCTAFCCFLLSFSMQFLLCNSGHGLRAMLSPKHVGQMLQVVNFRHVSFSFGEHPETTTWTWWWWWWWWWIWRISLVLMAIPEVICFRVVTQDLSYNYICRRWTPNWECPCRKQYVLLQETMAQTAQAACALDMSCVSWQTKSSLGGCWIHILSWIRKNIREKQTRAAWLINFKHHHEEFWISGPVSVKSFLKMASGLRRKCVVSCLQKRIYMGGSKNRVTPKWMVYTVYTGKPCWNGGFGGYHYFWKHLYSWYFSEDKKDFIFGVACTRCFLSQVR